MIARARHDVTYGCPGPAVLVRGLRLPAPGAILMGGNKDMGDTGKVYALQVGFSDDASLLAGLRRGQDSANAAFFRRYHRYVERLITRVMGFDTEIPDLVQEAFLGALRNIRSFRGDAGALPTWLGQIAIRTARGCIRKRQALHWLDFRPASQLEDMRTAMFRPEERQVLERTYAALGKLPVKERIVFVLRVIEGLEVTEVASLCEISEATVKRRSRAAGERFWRIASRDPVLREWQGGDGGPQALDDDGNGNAPTGAAEGKARSLSKRREGRP